MPDASRAACRRWSIASPASNARSPQAIEGSRYDIGIIEHSWCAPYRRDNSRRRATRTVLDLHNVESHLARALRRSRARRRRLRAPCLSRTRRAILERTLAAALLAGARHFRAAMRRWRAPSRPAPTSSVYPNALPADAAASEPGDEDVIVFSGNMEYHPNLAAVRIFPPRGLAQSARALARIGLAPGGEESGGRAPATRTATRGSRSPAPWTTPSPNWRAHEWRWCPCWPAAARV